MAGLTKKSVPTEDELATSIVAGRESQRGREDHGDEAQDDDDFDHGGLSPLMVPTETIVGPTPAAGYRPPSGVGMDM